MELDAETADRCPVCETPLEQVACNGSRRRRVGWSLGACRAPGASRLGGGNDFCNRLEKFQVTLLFGSSNAAFDPDCEGLLWGQAV